MRLSLVSDASEAYFHAVCGLLTPKQQVIDHERAASSAFVRPEVPARRVLIFMNYLYKTKLLSGT
jgi:hypothetical protein